MKSSTSELGLRRAGETKMRAVEIKYAFMEICFEVQVLAEQKQTSLTLRFNSNNDA